jgi:hypothetical protein
VSSEAKAIWEATSVQNLVRYRPAGTYFARFRVNGKRVWKSLETTVFSVAKQRLPETIREHRAKLESVAAVTIGKMTVGDAARVSFWKQRAEIRLEVGAAISWGAS